MPINLKNNIGIMKKHFLSLLAVLCLLPGYAQQQFILSSPNEELTTNIQIGKQLTYDITYQGKLVLESSALSIQLSDGKVWGDHPHLSSNTRNSVNELVASPFYRSKEIIDNYNQLILKFKGNWNVEFRAYNDGIAYRFIYTGKKPLTIANEEVNYNFPIDAVATVPFVKTGADGDFESQYFNSFENIYTTDQLSKLNDQRLMFLPLIVDLNDGIKVCLTESDLESYPGLYLQSTKTPQLKGHFAAYPKTTIQGGHNQLQQLVTQRENYIAEIGSRSLPWRIAIVVDSDKALASCNLSYLLAAPSRIQDVSWIKPGKVAWDWWNDWNIQGVDFESGVNNPTYKAYIDFAAEHGIEYVILDEGWAVNLQADLMQVVDDIDLPELISYAESKGVGIILWAGYYAFERDMENICAYYSKMGVKGFKVDFMDRDDQQMTNFNYKAAETAAKYNLILDLHGTHKPAGMNRTYPNVLNFEGVNGLEQLKWSTAELDQVKYDVLIPYIRQVSGPMDYTQGAMRNATRSNYYPCNNEPMSQGTRTRQLALYTIFESPLNMLCDAPSNYMREPECTEFIAEIPTVWDETIVLDGQMGEYIIIARRSGSNWYIGGITDWNERDVDVDLSFLPSGNYSMQLFTDGVNAHRKASDYKKTTKIVTNDNKLTIKMKPGGGFTAKMETK